MHRKVRQNIRRGLKRGITVRKGTEADLPEFYQLLQATSQRQGFVPYPEAYFQHMWRVLAPCSYLHLFLAEYDGEAVSPI
jgi:peptidoglycan pentaglycine glycine transferase (the first glycine)